jgi:hypothetical protein
MGFYQDHIFPVLINLAMRRQELAAIAAVLFHLPMAACWKLALGLASICHSIRTTWNALLVLIPRRNYSRWYGKICVPIRLRSN